MLRKVALPRKKDNVESGVYEYFTFEIVSSKSGGLLRYEARTLNTWQEIHPRSDCPTLFDEQCLLEALYYDISILTPCSWTDSVGQYNNEM